MLRTGEQVTRDRNEGNASAFFKNSAQMGDLGGVYQGNLTNWANRADQSDLVIRVVDLTGLGIARKSGFSFFHETHVLTFFSIQPQEPYFTQSHRDSADVSIHGRGWRSQ